MLGWLFRRSEPRPRSRSRLAGCLVWILALIALLIILSLLFGGFRKGTKAGADPPPPRLRVAVEPVRWGAASFRHRGSSSLFKTFPREFFGNSSRNSILRGYL